MILSSLLSLRARADIALAPDTMLEIANDDTRAWKDTRVHVRQLSWMANRRGDRHGPWSEHACVRTLHASSCLTTRGVFNRGAENTP